MKTLFILLILTIPTSSLLAEEIMINDNDNKTYQKAPFITSDRDSNLYVSWIDFREVTTGSVYFSKSTDKGKTWSKNIPIYNDGNVNANYQRAIDIKVGPNGNIYTVWMANNDGDPSVYFSRSTDGGNSFSEPKSISFEDDKYLQDFPSLAIDSSGNVHVAFVDARNQEMGEASNHQIMYIKSTDKGDSWTSQKVVSHSGNDGGSCECCSTDMEVSKEGNVYIAYRSNINNTRVTYLAYSENNGESFEEPLRIGVKDWYIEACPVTGPQISYDEKNKLLHFVYYTNGESFYTNLDREMNKPKKEVKFSDANYPALSLGNNGTIHVFYKKFIEGKETLLFRYSANGGNSFSEETMVGDNRINATFPRAINNNGNEIKIVYQKYGDNNTDNIYLYNMKNDVTPKEPTLPNRISENQEINLNNLKFEWEKPEDCGSCDLTKYKIKLTDESGEFEYTTYNNSITLNDVPESNYDLTFTASTFAGESTKDLLLNFKITDIETTNNKNNFEILNGKIFINEIGKYNVKLFDLTGKELLAEHGNGPSEISIPENTLVIYSITIDDKKYSGKYINY